MRKKKGIISLLIIILPLLAVSCSPSFGKMSYARLSSLSQDESKPNTKIEAKLELSHRYGLMSDEALAEAIQNTQDPNLRVYQHEALSDRLQKVPDAFLLEVFPSLSGPIQTKVYREVIRRLEEYEKKKTEGLTPEEKALTEISRAFMRARYE